MVFTEIELHVRIYNYIKAHGHTDQYVVVITPFGVLLLVYKADARGRGLVNRNSMTKRSNN